MPISVLKQFIRDPLYTRIYPSLPTDEVLQGLSKLNQLIHQYNELESGSENELDKQAIIKQICQHRYQMQYYVGGLDPVEQHRLMKELVKACESSNLDPIQTIHSPFIPAPSHSKFLTCSNGLTRLLTNMSYDKFKQFSEMLETAYEGDPERRLSKKLVSLYDENDPQDHPFRTFLMTHKIERLGNELANSVNYKVTLVDGGASMNLKLERMLSAQLRHEIPLSAQDDVSSLLVASNFSLETVEEKKLYSRVLVTDVCTNGDLLTYRANLTKPTNIILDAINFYSQMGIHLSNLQKAGYGFPDMKNSNWLIDDAKKLRCADTKSFIKPLDLKCFNGNIAFSESMRPPESENIDIDKMHVYLFGKNMYQFLTNKSNYELTGICAPPLPDTDKIAVHPLGYLLVTLINQTMDPNPASRPTLAEVNTTMALIQKKQTLLPVLLTLMRAGLLEQKALDVLMKAPDAASWERHLQHLTTILEIEPDRLKDLTADQVTDLKGLVTVKHFMELKEKVHEQVLHGAEKAIQNEVPKPALKSENTF